MKPHKLILSLLLLALGGAFAGEPMETSLDWRQLYYTTNWDRWFAKPLSEIRADAERGHVVAKYVYANKARRENSGGDSDLAERYEKECREAGLAQAIMEQVQYTSDWETPAGRMNQHYLASKAAAVGYPPGKLWLGMLLLSGKPIRPDPERALELIRSAYDEHAAGAARILAYLYADGIGEPRSPSEKPNALITEAVKEGDWEALSLLALRVRLGFAVERNLLRASKLTFSLNTNNGDIGVKGAYLPENDPDAKVFNHLLDLFDSALVKGDPASLAILGDMHAKGQNGAVNPTRAAALYDLAARAGNPEAGQKNRALVEKFDASQRTLYQGELKWMHEIRRNSR